MKNKYGYKKKISIDFYEKNLETLDRIKAFMPSDGVISNSAAVNYVLDIFGDLSNDVSLNMSSHIKATLSETEEKLKTLDINSFEYTETRQNIRQLEEMLSFFSHGKGYTNITGNMVRTDIQNGYVIYPDDWIVLDISHPSVATNAVVIETKNGAKYNAPYFIFFTNHAIISKSMESYILGEAVSKYPKFQEILSDIVEPVYDSNGNLLNEKEHLEAPCPGFFFLPDAGRNIRIYGDYTFGAKVFRTKGEQGIEK